MEFEKYASSAQEQKEGPVARAIEKQTSKIPSDIFLWAAGASIVGSLALQLFGNKPKTTWYGARKAGPSLFSLFVGQWAPTLLILGLYNKLVKVAGSDRYNPTP